MEVSFQGVNVWAAALIFARVGAMIMLLPGLGEPSIPARVRLGIALMVAMSLAPALMDRMPEAPPSGWGVAIMLIGELLVGLTFGAASRLLLSSLATAGQIVGLETGLAFAQTADPSAPQPGQIFAVFLGMLGIALVFATGLHRMFLAGIEGTYDIFAPGAPPSPGDAAQLAVEAVSTSFRVGFQISMPLIAAGLVFRLGLGVLSRLIPTIQVFFVIVPLQILGGFVIFALGLSTGMLVWLDSLQRYAQWVSN
jgi:flagellar biosynthetic protein FliR